MVVVSAKEIGNDLKNFRESDNSQKAEVAEWSKAVDLGSIPKGRGFKPHLLHFLIKESPEQLRSFLNKFPRRVKGLVPSHLIEVGSVLVAEGVVAVLINPKYIFFVT